MIRFYFILIFFLISLLAVLKAQAYYLWLLAIGVTEFPLVFAGITILLLLTGFWAHKYQMAGSILGVITLIIFLSPIFRAYIVARSIRISIAKAFDAPVNNTIAFSSINLFKSAKNLSYHPIVYKKYKDTSMSLDFYPSLVKGKQPCVIMVHGGSWAGGDSQQLPELNSYLSARGYNVAAINYRLAPKWQTPAPVEDIKNAIIYLKEHAAELNIDTTNFVLIGRSAGAQIALLAAYTLKEPDLKGVVDFYGPADMVWGYSIPSNPLIMDSRKVMGDYIGGTFKQVPQKFYACSPIEFVSRQSVPTLIIHGENDVLVSREHSRKLDAKLTQEGIKHYWLKLPWATHGFDFNLNGPGGQLSTYAVETFLKTVSPVNL